jgi:hypothetical protein
MLMSLASHGCMQDAGYNRMTAHELMAPSVRMQQIRGSAEVRNAHKDKINACSGKIALGIQTSTSRLISSHKQD